MLYLLDRVSDPTKKEFLVSKNLYGDEEIWRPILEKLNEDPFKGYYNLAELAPGLDQKTALENIWYLVENKLCTSSMKPINFGRFIWHGRVQITTKGSDFLRKDGGLSKRLRAITVTLDGETIKALVLAKLDETDAPEAEKSKVRHAVHSLSSNALSSLTGELVKQGLSQAEGLLPWLETVLRHL